MLVRADGEQLEEIGNLIDAGELRVFQETAYPIADAKAAYLRARRGGMRGKIALNVVQ
jgi:NADPH:quinone reductase-like Zn-dependent oxidoreductase